MLMCTSHKGVKSLLIEWKNEQKSDSVRDTSLNTYIYSSIDAMKGMLEKRKEKKKQACAGIQIHSISIQLSSLQL